MSTPVLTWRLRDAVSYDVPASLKKKAKKLAPEEAAVCLRLRLAREKLGVSQEHVAQQLSVSRERVASYENMRVAVPFDFALRFCHAFIISEQWLAEGRLGPKAGTLVKMASGRMVRMMSDQEAPLNRNVKSLVAEPAFRQIAVGTTLRSAWGEKLKSIYDRLQEENPGPRMLIAEGDDGATVRNYLHSILDEHITLMEFGDQNTPRNQMSLRMRYIHSLVDAARTIYASLCTPQYLTQYEKRELLHKAMRNGLLSDADDSDPEKRDKYALDHTAEFLRLKL